MVFLLICDTPCGQNFAVFWLALQFEVGSNCNHLKTIDRLYYWWSLVSLEVCKMQWRHLQSFLHNNYLQRAAWYQDSKLLHSQYLKTDTVLRFEMKMKITMKRTPPHDIFTL